MAFKLHIHILQLIILLSLPPYLISNDDYSKGCENLFSCGKITNIGFPFWGENRPIECGHPLMELTCQDNISYITIKDVEYQVLEANPDERTLRITREDYLQLEGLCPTKPVNNTTLDTEIFVYGQNYYNLTLLYGCQIPYTLPSSFGRIPCLLNEVSDAYVYTWFGSTSPPYMSCEESLVVPVSKLLNIDIISDFIKIQEAIRDGFVVRWITGIEECNKCVTSGGFCGWSSNQPTCFKAPPQSGKGGSKVGIVIGAFLISVVVAILIVIICKRKNCLEFVQKKIFKKTITLHDDNVQKFIKAYKLSMPKQYSYAEVKRITNSFRDKLGQGGYGVVYKASLPDGRHVAVKLINESKGDGEEFINEVASISRTSHVNIVSLLGFCYEKNKRALIYEFVVNGSLDKFIYRSGFPSAISNLDWNTLCKIAVGIARGLEYLHQGCSSRILHLDIKPQNILLDEDFCPKISDFGLAKICQKNDSIVSILGTRGTIGFIAPEVFSRSFGGVSHKSDVYSYGMLILEMIGGRKNYDSGGSHTSEMYFPDWIYKKLELSDSFRNDLAISEEEKDMIRKLTMVSLWCIQTNPSDRPSMSKVIEMLQGPLQSVPYPPRPVLYSPKRASLQSLQMSSSNLLETNSITIREDVP